MASLTVTRLRDNYGAFLSGAFNHTYHFDAYNSAGLYDSSYNFLSSDSFYYKALLMGDVNGKSKRHKNLGAGVYPLSDIFHMVTDFSKVGRVVDFPAGEYVCRFDSGNRCYLPISDFMLRKVVGSSDAVIPHWELRVPEAFRNDLSEQAFIYFSDVFPQELSFSEFLQGAFQLADLIPQIGSSISKTISGGYLNKEFGWDNLLADLGTLGTLIDDTLARMEFFRITYGRPTRLGFAREIDWTPSLDTVFYTEKQAYGVLGTDLLLHAYKAKYRATAWIFQILDHVDGLEGFLRVMTGMLGLDNPVKAFWNTIPLSFVVDWFFNTSQHLSGLLEANPAVGWDVNDVSHSITYDLEWQVRQIENYYHNPGIPVGESFPIHQHVYERYTGLSYDLELVNPESLSGTQLTLLLAMLHQFS